MSDDRPKIQRSLRIPVLVSGLLITGACNSLLTKWQDMICVEDCDTNNPILFEQPVFQSLNMFGGEMLCFLPLLWTFLFSSPNPSSPFAAARPSRAHRALRRITGNRTSSGYQVVGSDDGELAADHGDDDEEAEVEGALIGSARDGPGGGDLALDADGGSRKLEGWAMALFWLPAFCDICGTTLMNYGLILTPVSIYQMTRGSLVLFVGLLSVVFLRRHLFVYQWLCLTGVMGGVALVGLSGMLKHTPAADLLVVNDEGSAEVALGIFFIMFAQVFTASQFVIEEKIMAVYTVDPLLAVGLEGFFGFITTVVAMPILHYFFAASSPYFDLYRLWHQVTEHRTVWVLSFAIMLSISSFNYFGLSVTATMSATARSTIDTCRTILIWIVSVSIGWEILQFPSSVVQLAGFALLVYFTLIFNGLIESPFFRPGGGVALPTARDEVEEILAETALAPAEGGVGRVGYDVLPRSGE